MPYPTANLGFTGHIYNHLLLPLLSVPLSECSIQLGSTPSRNFRLFANTVAPPAPADVNVELSNVPVEITASVALCHHDH